VSDSLRQVRHSRRRYNGNRGVDNVDNIIRYGKSIEAVGSPDQQRRQDQERRERGTGFHRQSGDDHGLAGDRGR
jgi:hypothetical protein